MGICRRISADVVSQKGADVTELYRHYDASGCLLYVGVSLSTAARTAQHMGERDSTITATKPWLAEGLSRATWYRRRVG